MNFEKVYKIFTEKVLQNMIFFSRA